MWEQEIYRLHNVYLLILINYNFITYIKYFFFLFDYKYLNIFQISFATVNYMQFLHNLVINKSTKENVIFITYENYTFIRHFIIKVGFACSLFHN